MQYIEKNHEQHPQQQSMLGVNIAGYMTAELGVGEGARSHVRALQSRSFPVALTNIRTHPQSRQCDFSFQEFDHDNPYPINIIYVNADMCKKFFEDFGNDWFRGKYNIGFWNWELSDFPKSWRDSFQYYDEIWSASEFSRRAIVAHTDKPVYAMPFSVGITDFSTLNTARLGIQKDEFTFLFIFDLLSYLERKNPFGLIRSFKDAFSKDDKVRLLLKCCNAPFAPDVVTRMQEEADDSRITIIKDYFFRDEVNALLRACDAYVSLHRGEGFGFTLAEAMYLGKPVIATNYSSTTEFMNPENSYLINYKIGHLQETHGPYEKGFQWAEPDLQQASEMLRYVYVHQDDARRKGEEAARAMKEKFNYRIIGGRIISRLKAIARI